MREFTPELITSSDQLPPNARVFVGTNTEGRHGKGGALMARNLFGLVYGVAAGPSGRGYGIITKDLKKGLKSVTLDFIYNQIIDALIYAEEHPKELCYHTKYGSSLAGFSIQEMKGMFKKINDNAYIPENVILPIEYEVRA